MGSFNWVGEYDGFTPIPTPTPTLARTRSRIRSRKKHEFVGWGSRTLIEFLELIGRDTSKPISQYDVASIITEYVNHHNLIHPAKKKRILCDERLHSLFGRKTIGRIKIYDLLQQHFADNQEEDSEDSDDNDFADASEGEEEHKVVRQPLQKKPKTMAASGTPTPKSCFAAVIPENIKLVYLRKSLVESLLKQEDFQIFEGKVVGSFVRIKSDPNDYLQKNSHQLLQVTALNKASASGNGDGGGIILQFSVSGMLKEVPISMLSDDNFSQQECEDLHQRIKGGLLKNLTVVELQQKVQMLHEDITRHWLVRELAYLQNLIDRANEKGRRRELFEYLERRQLLQTPDEQARLLREVPQVMADEIEIEVAPKKDSPDEEVKQGNCTSPKDSPICDTPANRAAFTWNSGAIDFEAGNDDDVFWQEWELEETSDILKKRNGETKHVIVEDNNKAGQQIVDKQVVATQVVDLSNDVETEERCDGKKETPGDEMGGSLSSIWHYLDPQGNIQGPFTIDLLKCWSDADYFPPDFKIWKTGQSSDEAVFLKDILDQTFLNKLYKTRFGNSLVRGGRVRL